MRSIPSDEVNRTASSLVARPEIPCDAIVYPVSGPLAGTIVAQPSKNYTSRYLLAAALAHGESVVRNCATSDDARSLQRCLRALGARVDTTTEILVNQGSGEQVLVQGFGGKPRVVQAEPLDVGNAGAVLRLLLGVGALLPEVTWTTKHSESLGKRPNGDLLNALKQLGSDSISIGGLLPITQQTKSLHGGRITVSGARSSQFLSSLLFLAPLVGERVEIEVVDGLVSIAPVQQTLEVMQFFGVVTESTSNMLHHVIQPQKYSAQTVTVNGDWPGSAALLSAAAVTRASVEIQRLYDDKQGERQSVNVLTDMGTRIRYLRDSSGGVCIDPHSNGALRPVEFDGDLATDAVLALIGAAAFAKGRSRFYNVSNLRIKECDRISEPITELRKLGVKCWEGSEVGDSDPDAIIVEGNPAGYEGGVTVDGRGDHRVIMLLSIIALRCKKPVRITGANHVAKSYPRYFEHLAHLGADVRLVEPE